MPVDADHRYSNEADIDFKLKEKPFGLHGLYKNISAL